MTSGLLDHSVGGPVRDCTCRCQERCSRVGHVEVGLQDLRTGVELVGEPRQEVRRNPIVGIEHHHGLVIGQRMA
jgi:hypothetical protein